MKHYQSASINRDLVLEFFLVLSRMEFALKLTGYAIGNDKNVRADWDSFSKDISISFNSENKRHLSTAINYYLSYPPQKQIFTKGQLSWAASMPNKKTEIEQALTLVRRVRNNLFHGGKYNGQQHDETERNEELLRMGITIINETMRLSPKVSTAYHGAAI